MPTPACLATAVIGAPGSATNTAFAAWRISSSLRAACARRPLSGSGTAEGVAAVLVMASVYWNKTFCSDIVERKVPFRSTEVAVLTSPGSAPDHRWRWLAFAAALVAAAMDLLDSTIAQVAAPAIRNSLGGSDTVIEWVTAAYTLSMAVGLLTGGRLGDIYGRKRMLLIGIAAFMVASVACAFAASPGELIAARAAQGAAGAVMIPQVFGLIRDLFGADEMGKALGVFGPVMGLSAMLGPLFSGGLIAADIMGSGWRMIFLVNLPIGAFALLAGARFLPSAAISAPRARLDLLGAAVPVLAAFAWYQARRKRAGAAPLVEPGIFARRAYSSGVLFSIVFVGSMGGIVLIFNVLLQAWLGFSPWHSALTTAPWAAGAFAGSAIGGITMGRLG